VDAIQQNNVFNALNAPLKDLDPKPASGSTLESAVSDACAALKQPASGDQTDVTNALELCK
jgi:hypothetical protein